MIRKSKWIEGIAPDAPLSSAARTALEPRLRLVWYYLKRSARHADRDVEYVHQLRVCTRRAMATVAAFEAVLPPKRSKRIKRSLQHIRRAAGEARDLDVLIDRYRAWARERADQGGRQLLGALERRRKTAQRPLAEIYEKQRQQDFPDQVDELLVRTRPRGEMAERGEPGFALAARACLNPIVESFFTAGAGDLADLPSLHAFRILGKQLRYAIEIFVGAFGSPLREDIYPTVEKLQELLGALNDHAGAYERFRAWSESGESDLPRPLIEELMRIEGAARDQSEQQFRAWWTPARLAELRSEFDELLFRPTERQAG
ncbi:MAG: CHAD domain-containing protein [Pirellulales bacterium]|nr:CHAD domain-containing protein [Pirellulales bacterium]